MASSTVRIHGVGIPVSKLRPPRVRHGEVTREALLERLSDEDAEIVAVQAPAGYGKSTLAIQWASAGERPVGWVTVDPTDNDPLVLIGSIAAALSTAFAQYRPPDLLVSDEPAYSRVVLPSFISSVASLPLPVTLVMDDLHHVSSRSSGHVLRAVIDALPSGSQSLLIGRDLHLAPIALWRGQGRVVELRASDLAFSAREAKKAVAAFHADCDADSINTAAGGWPVAVFLMSQAHSPAELTDIEEFIESEVLGSMAADLRDFVLDTAPLGAVTPDLATAITGEVRAGHFLSEAITTVLLQPSESGWYVYHPLLQECVTAYLQREDPERLRGVRMAAADWHLRAGHLDTAVRLAVSAGDDEHLGIVLWEAARPTLLQGRASTVRLWLDLVEPRTIDRVAALSLAAAWSNVSTGVYAHAIRHGRQTLDLLPNDWREEPSVFPFAGHLALLQAATWLGLPDSAQAVGAGALACALLQADDPAFCLAMLLHGLNLALQGDAGAEDDILQALAHAQSSAIPSTAVEALAIIGLVRLGYESITAGCEAIDRANEIFALHDLHQMTSTSAVLALARVALAATRGREAEVRAAMHEQAAVRRQMESILPWYAPLSDAVLADVCVAIGDTQSHHEYLLACERSRIGDRGIVAQWASRARRRHAASSPLSILTPAELRVWDQLHSRMTLTEIASALFLSRETVKSHTASIYRKLGVATRREAQDLADTWQ